MSEAHAIAHANIALAKYWGKAGKHAVPWLKAKGYDILNLDLKPLDCPGHLSG